MDIPRAVQIRVDQGRVNDGDASQMAHININVGGNYVRINGPGPDGPVDEAIMLDDPDFAEKFTDKYKKLSEHQRSQLEKYVTNALDEFDRQNAEASSQIEEIITNITDNS